MSQKSPWVSPFPGDNEPRPGLGDLVKDLTVAVAKLTDQQRTKRRSDRMAYATLGAVVLFLVYYFAFDLPQRRTEIRDQIRDLACYAVRLRPPGYSAQSDDLRKRYSCPPFNPSAIPSTGAPSREPTPGATVTRQVPGPSRTVTRTPAAAGSGAVPAPTVTRTVTPPVRTVTVVPAARTRTTTRTVPGPTVTRGICVPGVLC